MSVRKWLGSKIAGVSIDGLERQRDYFHKQIEDMRQDQKKIVNEYRFIKNQLLYNNPKVTISRDNIITLRHRLLIKDGDIEATKAYVVEGFKKTILDNNFINFTTIEDEQSGQKVLDATIRIIRP